MAKDPIMEALLAIPGCRGVKEVTETTVTFIPGEDEDKESEEDTPESG